MAAEQPVPERYREGERVLIKDGPHPWGGEIGIVVTHEGFAVEVALPSGESVAVHESWVERLA
jgi:hypothetical protein